MKFQEVRRETLSDQLDIFFLVLNKGTNETIFEMSH